MFLMLIPSDLGLEISSPHTSIFLAVGMLARESYRSESGRRWCPEPEDKLIGFDLVWPRSYRGLATVPVELSDPVSLKVVLSFWLSHSLGYGEWGQRLLQGAVRPPTQPSAPDQPAAAPVCAAGCLPGDWQPRWQCGGAQGVSPGEDVSAAFQVRGRVGTLELWRCPALPLSGTQGRDQNLVWRACSYSRVLVSLHSGNKNSVARFSEQGLLPLSWNPLPTAGPAVLLEHPWRWATHWVSPTRTKRIKLNFLCFFWKTAWFAFYCPNKLLKLHKAPPVPESAIFFLGCSWVYENGSSRQLGIMEGTSSEVRQIISTDHCFAAHQLCDLVRITLALDLFPKGWHGSILSGSWWIRDNSYKLWERFLAQTGLTKCH